MKLLKSQRYPRQIIHPHIVSDGPQQSARERFLIGWHNVNLNRYYIATIDTFGRMIEVRFGLH